MFRSLLSARNTCVPLTRANLEIHAVDDEDASATLRFFEQLHDYAFYQNLVDTMGQRQLKEATVTARLDWRARRLIEVAAGDRGVTVSRFVADSAERAALDSLIPFGNRQEAVADS